MQPGLDLGIELQGSVDGFLWVWRGIPHLGGYKLRRMGPLVDTFLTQYLHISKYATNMIIELTPTTSLRSSTMRRLPRD